MSKNLSRLQLKELNNKIKNISIYIEETADKDFKELLQGYLCDIEKSINEHKYGLIFEEHRENIEYAIENDLVFLKEIQNMEINKGGKMNFLIEGDNLATLCILEKKLFEKIDLIIIDPPYNTGKRDMRYKDCFYSEKDEFSHSKWLSFMEKRLNKAKNLLAEKGYIFINIDENELAHLKLLCDEIFGEKNFVGIYLWEKTTNPPTLSNKIRKRIEYILCYAKSLHKEHKFCQGRVKGIDSPLINTDNKIKKLVFPKNTVKFSIPDGTYYETKSDKVKILKPVEVKDGVNSTEMILEGPFKWDENNLAKEIELGTYFIIRSRKFLIRYQREIFERPIAPQNLLNSELGIGTNKTATGELNSLKIKGFEYPKPVSLYEFIINMVNQDKDMVIMDFFAGSGTTGEAVLKINKEQGKNHRFILCNDNKNKICQDVTYNRIKNTMEKNDFEGILKYFKVCVNRL